jgi:hypothetical protein
VPFECAAPHHRSGIIARSTITTSRMMKSIGSKGVVPTSTTRGEGGGSRSRDQWSSTWVRRLLPDYRRSASAATTVSGRFRECRSSFPQPEPRDYPRVLIKISRAILEGAMRTFAIAIVLSGSCATLGWAQPPDQSTNRNVLQPQSQPVPRPSPAERIRCNQPRKALNAASRKACRNHW